MASRRNSQSPPQYQPNPQNWLNLGGQSDTEAQNNALMESIFNTQPPQYPQAQAPPAYLPFIPPINTEGQFQYPQYGANVQVPFPQYPYGPNMEIPNLVQTQGSGGSRHASHGSTARPPSQPRALFQDSQPHEEVGEDDDETQPPSDHEIPQPRRGVRNTSGNPPKKPRSEVWEHYDLIRDPRSGKCKTCGKIVSADNEKHGTNLVRQHHKKCGGRAGSSSSTVSIPSPESHREMIVRLIISTDLPISFVETDGFIEYVQRTLPGMSMVSRYTIRRDIFKYFEKKKK